MKIYLVEIAVKDWIHRATPSDRVVHYVEIPANNEYHARQEGFDEFIRLIKYSPGVKRKWTTLGLNISDICATDSVELDY